MTFQQQILLEDSKQLGDSKDIGCTWHQESAILRYLTASFMGWSTASEECQVYSLMCCLLIQRKGVFLLVQSTRNPHTILCLKSFDAACGIIPHSHRGYLSKACHCQSDVTGSFTHCKYPAWRTNSKGIAGPGKHFRKMDVTKIQKRYIAKG